MFSGNELLHLTFVHLCVAFYGLPRWRSGKESRLPIPPPRRFRRHKFDPWVRKMPQRREWQPTSVFLPGKSHGQRSLAGYSPWGLKESNATEHAHTWLSDPSLQNCLQNIKSCLQVRVSSLPHLQNCLCTRPALTAL